MSDSNITSDYDRERFIDNKFAFDEVVGDPFAVPEPIDGHYYILKSRGPVAAMKNNFDEGKATVNPATPNPIDFFCDVERTIEDALEDPKTIGTFFDIYIDQSTEVGFDNEQRVDVEQKVGALFRKRHISPVSKYFRTTRKKDGK